MKQLKYLSPTSISQWLDNKQEFYLKYLAEDAPDRFPQTQPMSVGSAFDAYAKAHLHNILINDGDARYEFETLFETQVEPQNRDFAKEAGLHCFESYKISGALADLMRVLVSGKTKFEFTVQGVLEEYRDGIKGQVGDVIFLGKPDAMYHNIEQNITVILDWKVNGYCGNSNKTPCVGYSICRDGWLPLTAKSSRSNNSSHKDAHVERKNGWDINYGHKFNEVEQSWARQLSIYSWLTGQPVGGDFIIAIDQLCCDGSKRVGGKPLIRVAELRMHVCPDFQRELYALAQNIWTTCQSGWIFREMTEEQSLKKQADLDDYVKTLRGEGTEKDLWLASVARGQNNW